MRDCAVVDCLYWLIPRCFLMWAHTRWLFDELCIMLLFALSFLCLVASRVRAHLILLRFSMLDVRAKCFVNRGVSNGLECFFLYIFYFVAVIFLFFFSVFCWAGCFFFFHVYFLIHFLSAMLAHTSSHTNTVQGPNRIHLHYLPKIYILCSVVFNPFSPIHCNGCFCVISARVLTVRNQKFARKLRLLLQWI